MIYIMLLLSLAIIIYNYNKLIKQDKDIKTFAVISVLLTTGILHTIFLDELKKYSLLKTFKVFSEFIMPWFVEFMKL